ncbi:MAG TPA: Stp1/IreP family PP2C-type Ser/Thr phosphatase [Macromonas sp.]|nr:Stp1/IreP family PP2C-type Ser/Thr phosphatase [Macromonas sp.]
MQRRFFCLSDTGRVRTNNEDAVLTDPASGLALLADGMGGYNAGEVASALAIEAVLQGLQDRLRRPPGSGELQRWMLASIEAANARILAAAWQDARHRGMGTTLVAAAFTATRLVVGHVGDSRLYRFRQGQLVQLTRDHSLLQEQIDAGLISASLARQVPYKNVVTRALGVGLDIRPDIGEHAVQAGDTYLLCSDGLNDMLSDAQIAATLRREPALEAAGHALLAQANDAGGRDNVSLILVQCAPEHAHPRHASLTPMT